MDLKELRTQYPEYDDLSDQELADSFHAKYYSDIPRDQFYQQIGLNDSGAPQVAVSSLQPPPLLQQAAPVNSLAQRVAPWVRGAAEAGGMLGGGLLGAAAGLGPGSAPGAVAGAGLGYAGGKQLANLYEQFVGLRRPEGNFGQAITGAAGDVAQGAAMEAGGGIGENILARAGQRLAPQLGSWAEDIYGRLLKPSTTLSPVTRKGITRAAVENKIYPTQEGQEKLRALIDKINQDITRRIGRGEKTINMQDVVSRLDEAKKLYRNLPPAEARPFLRQIDKIKQNYLSAGDQISGAQAQKMKQSIYSLIGKHYGELKGAQIEARKQIARGLKEELVKQYPELAALNAQDSALLELDKALTRAVNRLSNRDLIGLTELGGGLAGHAAGAPAALALAGTKAARLPGVQAHLAFALQKGAKALAKTPVWKRKASSQVVSAATIPSLPTEEQRWKSIGNEY